ncbi:MAG: hypothetical protein V3W44_09655 [Dehalococcoidales bacterium]
MTKTKPPIPENWRDIAPDESAPGVSSGKPPPAQAGEAKCMHCAMLKRWLHLLIEVMG